MEENKKRKSNLSPDFLKHLKASSQIVSDWPDWMQTVLDDKMSGQTSSSEVQVTAKPISTKTER